MNRFIQIQEELINKRSETLISKPGKYSQQTGVIEFEPEVITISKSRKERLLKNAGWKKASVTVTITDFKGNPLMGHRVYLEIQSPNVAAQYDAGEVRGGTVIFSDVWMKPAGTVRLIAVKLNTPAPVPSGVEHYNLPQDNFLKISASQKAMEVEVTATSSEEAATKVGATGKAGVDFKVFSLGGSVSGEEQKKTGQSISQKFNVLIPTDTLEIKILPEK